MPRRYLAAQLGAFAFSALSLCIALMNCATAQAKWGPKANCGIRDKPLEHCYALAKRTTSGVYASIAAEDNENAVVYDWQNGGFISNEQWISFTNQGITGWIENGITAGNYRDCCTVYPFYAEQTPKKGPYHEYIAPGPVASGSGQYNYDLIFDGEHNGAYHIYWSAATNTWEWIEVARYGGGWPVWITEQEAGMEAASEYAPLHAGRDMVAASNGGEWWPWTGSKYTHDPGVCIGHNRENGAEGNLEWTPGHNEC